MGHTRLSPAAALLFSGAAASAQLAVVTTAPTLNAINTLPTGVVSVTFDRPVDPATLTPGSFRAFARWSGPVSGVLSLSNGDRTATLTPAAPFQAGELVTVNLARTLRGADGSSLRAAGYTLAFTVRSAPSSGAYCHLATFSDRSPGGGQTRIYGGLACDLDRDGWPDLTTVNEVSADLRVFLNRADGSGLFWPMTTPPAPIPFESSPNEPADFDGDGIVDIATTSNDTHQVAIARGLGNGQFAPATLIALQPYPRGVAVIDAEADGDDDLFVCTRDTDNIAFLRNTGGGVFASPLYFPSGGDGPYGMVSADMNNDGIHDLVVGHANSQTVTVLRGGGDGSFTLASSRSIGGYNWVVAAADANGDGNMDIAAANSVSNNATVLLGNGDGTLQAAATLPTGGHTVSTDFADMDGDGDQDLIVSSFGARRWYLYTNTGSGQFAPGQVFNAPGNPACSLFADFDRDGDVDLILLDETTDLVLMMRNMATGACYPNCDCSGTAPLLNVLDFNCFLNRFASGDLFANCDGSTAAPLLNVLDFNCFLNRFAQGCP